METEIRLPVKDYAAKMGVSVQYVYQQLRRGKIKGVKIGNYQLILTKK
jgi:hypothetical protein